MKPLLAGLVSLLAVAADAGRPNFVLIFADDMGWGDPGCQGGTMAPTPAIDSLARDGVRCTDGYVAAPVCCPSRHGLMSGAYPQSFGVQWNTDRSHGTIPAARKLLPETLKAAGYATGLIGKWNVNRDPAPMFDEVHDLMDWEGDYWPDAAGHYTGLGTNEHASGKVQGVWGPERPGDEYLTDRLGRHAVEFVKRRKDGPFFLYLAFNAVHSPWHGKLEHKDRFGGLKPDPLPFYASMIVSMDDAIGRVLDALKEAGVAGNTFVAFVSDNGPAKSNIKGARPEWPKDTIVGSTGGLNGWKAQYLEGGIRVPFLLRWPERLKAGSVYGRPVSSMDLYATFCAAAGIATPDGTRLDGVDLLPFLAGAAAGDPHADLFWMHDGQGAMRRGDWKLVVSPSAPKLRLFDLAADRAEARDLAAEKPDVLAGLHAAWTNWCAGLPPAANAAERAKGTPPQPVAGPVTGRFGITELKAPDGKPFTAYTVTTADGVEFLLYHRLATDHLGGRKAGDLAGGTVRVTGEATRAGTSGRFSTVTAMEFLGK
ncbi:MAG: sulfatase [Lentisphaerae bacterium]|nr:sulfatase [Lentisphaerota bacterium]